MKSLGKQTNEGPELNTLKEWLLQGLHSTGLFVFYYLAFLVLAFLLASVLVICLTSSTFR
jgi:hypothetical protein